MGQNNFKNSVINNYYKQKDRIPRASGTAKRRIAYAMCNFFKFALDKKYDRWYIVLRMVDIWIQLMNLNY